MNLYKQLLYLASNPINDLKRLETRNGDIINSSELVLKNLQEDFEIDSIFGIDFRRACEQVISYQNVV